MITNLPNMLTLSRVLMVPLLVAVFFLEGDTANWAALAVFTAASLTDFFDGYFARVRHQQSEFGRFLDPIADKLLVATAIIMLAAFGRLEGLTVLPAVVILCREFVVSGLREYLGARAVELPVSKLAKWKTFIQMVAIGFLLVGPASPDAIPSVAIGQVGLWLAAGLTLITGLAYLRGGIRSVAAADSGQEMDTREGSKPAGKSG